MSNFERDKAFITAVLDGSRSDTIVVNSTRSQRLIRTVSILRRDEPILSYYEVVRGDDPPLRFDTLNEAVSCYVEREPADAP